VEILKAHTESGVEEGYHTVLAARFAGGEKQRVIVNFRNDVDHSLKATEYQRTAEGTWQVASQIDDPSEADLGGLAVTVKQGLNEPPVLVASKKGTSRVMWDPNPQLKDIELGKASVYEWMDKQGRHLRGGLYKPSDYRPGALPAGDSNTRFSGIGISALWCISNGKCSEGAGCVRNRRAAGGRSRFVSQYDT